MGTILIFFLLLFGLFGIMHLLVALLKKLFNKNTP